MAEIDRLLDDVNDPSLRQALQREVDRLRDVAEFGLVFERHLPEEVLLYGQPVYRGSTVVQPAGVDPMSEWLVTSIEGGTAELASRSTGEKGTCAIKDLVVVRRFGEPIYPGLSSLGRIERGGDKPFHTVINGENFHALEMLTYLHEGQVDAIYIDPPYNSGARDWKYNNDYIDGNDSYRHSKWLSFMERRLRLAKRLLNPSSSALVVTIDEKEVHALGMLLADIFPAATRQMVTIVINPLGQARKAELARVEEFAFFVLIGEMAPNAVIDDLLTDTSGARAEKVRWEWLLRGGTNSRRVDRPNLFYPIYLDPNTARVIRVGHTLPIDVNKATVADVEGAVTVWPLRRNGDEGSWRLSSDKLRELLELGLAKVGVVDKKRNQWSILYLGSLMRERLDRGDLQIVSRDIETGAVEVEWAHAPERIVKTVWSRPSHRAGEYGTRLLKDFIGPCDFPFPKSLYAVEDTLRILCADKPDALILDFFAGSGTTMHATALLNAEDGGHRRSITITNNEVGVDTASALAASGLGPLDPEWQNQGIFWSITKPRVEAATTGLHADGTPVSGQYLDGTPYADGLVENVEFFELSYLDPDAVAVGRAFSAIAPLLWLRAGATGSRLEVDRIAWWAPSEATYGVLFDTSQAGPFLEAVATSTDLRVVYIITNSDAVFQQVASELPAGVSSVQLYSDYLRNFQINHGELA